MQILQLSPELEGIVDLDREIEEIGNGYQVAEGPLWWREGGYLLFNEVRGNRRWKWTPAAGMNLLQEPSNNANGLTRDQQGRQILCEGGAHRVTRIEEDGNITVVADSYQGKSLNRPNDVVVKSDGSIYFTDPGAPDPDLELDFAGVYRVSPDLTAITLLVRDFVFPNGLAFSPDENILYIDDYRRGHIRAFDVQTNGTLALATDRVFCSLRDPRPIGADGPDGMKVDVEGNVYCTGPGGVCILNQDGQHLGTILTGAQTTNVAWGGADWKTLFITTFATVGRIQLNISGVPVPH